MMTTTRQTTTRQTTTTTRTRTTTDFDPSRLLALALGSNLGHREAHLRRAIDQLTRALGPLRVASLYQNAALLPPGGEPQPDYLNTVVLATVDRMAEPVEILALTRALERDAGRRPGPRWAPRTLDVDLLLVGEHRCRTPELTLPHPELRRRSFVLAPLAELAPDLPLSPDGARAGELLADLGDRHPVVRRPWSDPPP